MNIILDIWPFFDEVKFSSPRSMPTRIWFLRHHITRPLRSDTMTRQGFDKM